MTLRRVEPATLTPGLRLPAGLFTRQGVKLLSAGVTLTHAMCRVVTGPNWGEIYFADSTSDLIAILGTRDAAADASTSPDQSSAPQPDGAHNHHFITVASSRDEARLRAARMRIADHYVADISDAWRKLPLRVRPLDPRSQRSLPQAPTRWFEEATLKEIRADRVRRTRSLFARINSGVPLSASEPAALINELMVWHARDPSRFAQIALHDPEHRQDLPGQAYSVATLSVAIARTLGWSGHFTRLAGLAGLLADLGMSLVPEELRAGSRALNEFELNRVRRHPAFGVMLLDPVEDLHDHVRQAVYQHHERDNGSGYPLGLRARTLSDIARLVAVADAFIAAVSRRRYRPAKSPYESMEEMIMLASAGAFDRRAVRGLVQAVGLFPVGSRVILSTGTHAVVVGVRPDAIDRPIVRIVQRAASGSTLGLTLDLADFPRQELAVVRPLDDATEPLAA